MRYQRVEWRHDSPEYPIVLFAEIDDDSFEHRKVDVFVDGRSVRADQSIEEGAETWLSYERVPPLEEINRDSQFVGATISADEFEAAWGRARDAVIPGDIRAR